MVQCTGDKNISEIWSSHSQPGLLIETWIKKQVIKLEVGKKLRVFNSLSVKENRLWGFRYCGLGTVALPAGGTLSRELGKHGFAKN